jgi:hypothetical protein
MHGDEGMVQALPKNFRSTDNNHIVVKMTLPAFSAPQIASHVATKHIHRLIEVCLEYGVLLKDKSY